MKRSPLTIGRRVALGFALLLILASALGGFAIWRMTEAGTGARFLAEAVAPQAGVSSSLFEAVSKVQKEARSYSYTGEEQFLKLVREALAETRAQLDAAGRLATAQPALTALAEARREADKALNDYVEAFNDTEKNLTELARIRTTLDQQADIFIENIGGYSDAMCAALREEIAAGATAAKLDERAMKIQQVIEIRKLGNQVRVRAQKAQALREAAQITGIVGNFERMEALRSALVPLTRQPSNLEQLELVAKSSAAYHQGVLALVKNLEATDATNLRRIEAAKRFDAVIGDVLHRSVDRTLAFATESSTHLDEASTAVIVGLVVMALMGVVSAALIIRGVNRALTLTAENLTRGSLQVASAAGQVSSASQSLAEGSSEQAASLEEISSSIEELSSMTRRNADNALAGKTASDHARAAAETGAAEMARMQEAMNAIQQSSADISKIIKTIDEIAFQTNILALNAAVEAARAGEAGAGFAVVADEVRSLAQRSAVAAKETADKIADATQKSAQGVELSTRVGSGLREIVEKAREVDRLVAEVATASREQSEGLVQINTAVSQMDKVTQSNAAGAEETASAAEELNAQSAELQQAAAQLAALVGAAGSHRPAAPVAPARAPRPAVTVSPRPQSPEPRRAAIVSPAKPAAALHAAPAKPAAGEALSFKD